MSPNGDEPPKKKNKRMKRQKKNKKSKDEASPAADSQKIESKPAKAEVATAPATPVNARGTTSSKQSAHKPDNNTGKKRKLSRDTIKDASTHNAAINPTDEDTRPRYSFQVDDTDHCETPLQAYRDTIDILDRLAKSLNKTRSTLTIYDPYYCDGGVKKKLASFGFTSVINRNRDFYQDIDEKLTPEYDVLVTNPPYSGVHMEKILAYCSDISTKTRKPFLLLLPHFVYTKDYYQRALSPEVSSSIFFLVPEVRYGYIPPAWVEANRGSKALESGKNITAPFPSFWYCHAPTEMM
eukprot:CAMPEP_0201942012 /NCGR_PEP_ID=MMETSP0903-20130614/48181_1 /ASSEMBLY_ACC=CAM_ASM_000552 /TAXON_ID=420261 /ORGANISM="Thalassiosira antarctica, Strain CCMP982" /LENGTH=294 /DNA_ID=CAMNT_0048484231 /DNA_START=97 /DNA_END=978 /DNA_ORIENTATION=+